MDTLTVVVPTYDGSRHLAASLDSLARQTTPPRVLVVDDGSHDDSAQIARDHPVVEEVLVQPNRGVAAARNRGLANARTSLVAFMDQDDIWHCDRVERLIDLLGTTAAPAAGTREAAFALESDRQALLAIEDRRAIEWDLIWLPDGGEAELATKPVSVGEVEELSVARFMEGALSLTTSFVYRREAAITAGGCAPFIKAADDHVLNVNLANIFGPLLRCTESTVFYRVHPEATSNVSPLVMPLLTLQLALRHGRAIDAPTRLGPNLEHLLWQVADLDSLSRSQQLALLTLSTADEDRRRWLLRWMRRSFLRRAKAK